MTLLIPAMYTDIRHIESALDIADRDTGLEVRSVFEYTVVLVAICRDVTWSDNGAVINSTWEGLRGNMKIKQ